MGALMGTVKCRAKYVEIEIDHKFTHCRNISNVSVMAMAMKRTGTYFEEPLTVLTHFLKSAAPGECMSFPDDYDITNPNKIAEVSGMDYVIMVWPHESNEDPRLKWSPEVYVIRYEPTKFQYFPAICLLKDAVLLSEDTKFEFCAGLNDMCNLDLAVLLDQTYSTDKTTQDFETDREVPGNMIPWMEVISKSSLDPNTEYFCVETWGTGSAVGFGDFYKNFVDFYKAQRQIFNQLKSGEVHGLIGCTGGAGLASGLGVRAETLTVWQERHHMAAFFNSDLHKNAMEKFKGRISFKVRRLWIRSQDIPDHKDMASTKQFWKRVKGKQSKEANKAKHPQHEGPSPNAPEE